MPKQKPNGDVVQLKALLQSLEKSLGVVTTACHSIGCSRDFFYDNYKKHEWFRKAVDDIENIALDFAESQLHKQIKEGEVSATIFFLKCKGKKRGYIDKTEIDVKNTTPTIIVSDAIALDDTKALLDGND